jgi:hypothetical protein
MRAATRKNWLSVEVILPTIHSGAATETQTNEATSIVIPVVAPEVRFPVAPGTLPEFIWLNINGVQIYSTSQNLTTLMWFTFYLQTGGFDLHSRLPL